MDKISKKHRSWNMSQIPNKNTAPEKIVRSILHKLGYRFRLHRKDLPGSPDIVLPKHRTVIFVHGCYWHRHEGCKYAYNPKTRKAFWQNKFNENINRDKNTKKSLQRLGWRVIIIWECQSKNTNSLILLLNKSLNKR